MFNKLLLGSIGYILLSSIILGWMRRSALTQSLLHKYANDERHKLDAHAYWYELKTDEISDSIQGSMVQLSQDDETTAFLANCFEKSDAFFWQVWHLFAVPVLKLFMTQTDVNGYLGRGSMFVYSTSQFRKLLSIDESWRVESLLDLGAGDGHVTEKMAPHFHNVFVTEVSKQMRGQLTLKGFQVLDIDDWDKGKYDVISCLNLLDRCDKPLSLLRSIRSSVKPNGYVVIASVYPFSPYVEVNTHSNYQPSEKLSLEYKTIEELIGQMMLNVFIPTGFKLHSYSRVPYLCEGDLTTSFYVLSDIIFVLKPDDSIVQQ